MAARQAPGVSGRAHASLFFVAAGLLLGLLVVWAASHEPRTVFVEREWTKPWAPAEDAATWWDEWDRRAKPWTEELPDPPGYGEVETARYWLSRAPYDLEVRRRGDRVVVAVAGVDEQVYGGGWAAYGEGRIEGAEKGFAGSVATFRWSCLSVRYGTASDGVGRITFTEDGEQIAAVYMAHEAPALWYKAYGRLQREGDTKPERGRIKGQIPYAEALDVLAPEPTHIARVRVIDTQGVPLIGAVVQLRGHARTRQATDREGYATIRFKGSLAPIAQTFNAGKEGYFNAEASHFTGDLVYGREGVEGPCPDVVVELTRYEPGDSPAYEWVHPSKDADPDNAMACSSCHTWHYHEWIGSRHARMADNGLVEHVHAAMKRLAPEAPDDCVGCHQPAQAAKDPTARGWRRRGVMAGNHCDFCHKIERVTDLRESGVLGAIDLARPDLSANERPGGIGRVFGSAPDSTYAYMGSVYNPLYASSHMCASCHQGGGRWREGVPPKLDTFEEWRRWAITEAAQKKTPKTCQDCHMPAASIRDVEGTLVKQLAYDAMHREPEDVHGHRFLGRSPELAADAIQIDVTKARDEKTKDWQIRVTLENTGAGHKIPTGTWTKHVVVGVWAKSGDRWLRAMGGERALLVSAETDGEEAGAGTTPGDWRNPAGTILGMTVKGGGSNPYARPAFYAAWDPKDLVDRRLAPGEERVVEAVFDGEGVDAEPEVVVWIVHRRGDLGLGAAHAAFPIRPYDAPPEVVWKKVTR
ncbi:MAG: multiheme c-type cytochrome [Planctomycetota bacterium]|nr:multiheme c-type cytochrome [Planctomycetota bacterium]